MRLLQLLRDKGLTAAAALAQLEAQLDARGTDANEVLRREHRRQAVNQVSVANCVISLRVLSAIDWNDFFERQSHVEKILREDPSGVYAQQDFATRNRYRRVVEEIARGPTWTSRPWSRTSSSVPGPDAAMGQRAGMSAITWSIAATRS